MDTQDVLSLEVQKRTWSIARELTARNIHDVGGYLPFNNRLFASTLCRSHREPLLAYTSLQDLHSAMKFVMCLANEGDSEAAERHVEVAAFTLEAYDWKDGGVERAAAYEYLAEALLVLDNFPRARAAARIAHDGYRRCLELSNGGSGVEVDELVPLLGSAKCLLGYAYGREGNYAEALAHLGAGTTVLSDWSKQNHQPLEARLVWALEVYAEVLERAGKYEDAKVVLERILRIRLAQLHALAAPVEAALAATNANLSQVFELAAEAEVRE